MTAKTVKSAFQYDGPIGPAQARCPYCEREVPVSIRRQRTAYVDDDMNWIECCDDCFEKIDEYWADMWDMYYSMVR